MTLVVPVIPRQNSTANNPPTTSAVQLGELAINVRDGTLWTTYIPDGSTHTILQLGGNGFLTTSSASATYAPKASPTFSGTTTIPTVTITGGTIDATTIGATTPAAGSFTALSATSTTTLSAMNASSIGASTPGTGAFTTLTATTPSSSDNSTNVATTAWITSKGYSTGSITPATSSSVGGVIVPTSQNLLTVDGSGNLTFNESPSFTGTVTISSGTINNSTIGNTTPTTGSFTSLTASLGVVRAYNTFAAAGTTLATATALTAYYNEITSGTGGVSLPNSSTSIVPTGADCFVFNRSGASITIYPDSSSNTIESGSAGAGVTLPNLADARFTKISSTNWLSTGGDNGYYTFLNASSIGAQTPGTGAFTTLSASSTVSGTGFSNYLLSPPAIGTTTPAAGKFTTLNATGTTTLAAMTSTGITSSPISGSTGNFTSVGATTPGTGAFTTLSSSGLTTANSLSVTTTSTLTGVATLTAAPVLSSTTASTVLGSNSSKSVVSLTLSNGLVAGSGTLTITPSTMFPTVPSTITATTYTVVAANNNETLVFNPTANCVITIPTGLTAGFTFNVWNKSTYRVTWAPASGVTISCYPSTATGTAGQNAVMTFYCDTSTDWVVGGAIS